MTAGKALVKGHTISLSCAMWGRAHGRAHPQTHERIADVGLADVAVGAPVREFLLIIRAPAHARLPRSLDRLGPLPPVADQVVHAERALRGRVRSDLVGAESFGTPAVGDVD